MSRTTGTYTLTSNIEPKVGAPLDARTIVKLKSDLTTPGTFAYPYVGLTVFVEEDQKKYTLTDIHYTYIANWREEGSGTTTSADHVTYDNTQSQLISTNVQDAVDEIVSNLGTAASKDATDQVTEDSTDLITSGAVYDALENFPTEDTKVTQTATTADANYEILFSETADNTTRTEGAKKAATLRFNPSRGAIMEGSNSVATESNSHAEGDSTTASGNSSHAEGAYTCASGNGAHAEGGYASAGSLGTFAVGEDSHAEGFLTTASGKYSHAEGCRVLANNNNSHAEGLWTSALAYASHAEGSSTITSAEFAHAEGSYNSAIGRNSHAEGNRTCANGIDSHTEGYYTKTNSANSHAEGSYTYVSGASAHAEGYNTTASGKYSHAAGQGTCAAGQSQTVVGNYNTADTTSLFIVGDGTANNARSNALKVSSDGTTTLGASGTIASGNTQAVTGGAVYDALQALPSDDTWRSIQVNGSEVQDGTTSSGPLKLVNGTNTSVGFDSTNKTIQVNATDTNTTYSLTQDSSDGHKITLTPSTGTAQTLIIPDNNTTYTLSTGAANGQIKVTPSIGSAYNVDVKGLGSAAYKNSTTSVTQNSADLVTSGAVWSAIDNLPEPMIMKGTLGTGGTITSLPTASASNEGFVYKVITAGTYAGQAAKVGDFFVSCKPEGASAYSWIWFPSGDETFTDTWRSIKVNGTEKLGNTISSGAVDFVNGTNTTVEFVDDGKKIKINSSDTNTHRPIQVNGTQNLGNNTTPLNLKNGTNITVTADGGNVTIATSAEVNQNAFSNVKVGSTTVAADSKTDTLELVAGSNVTITPDATNDKITIAATDTNTHRPIQMNGAEILGNNTTALNLKAGSNVSLTNSSGTVTIAATNTTYSAGTGLTLDSGAFRTYVPRLNGSSDDSKTIPGVNRFNIREFGNTTLNLPYKEWYHLLTVEGDDSRYATQLALNMTNKAGVYYRKYDNSTWGDWYRLNGALIQKYQTISTTNKWYKLFTISYSQYNYTYLHLLIKAGYENMYEVFLCLRFTPNGIIATDSYAKIIPYNSSSKNVRLYQVNDTTFGLAVNAQGATSQIGFELVDMSSEADGLNAWSLTIANPFTELEAGPAAFGNHRYFTGNYADINGTPSLNYLPLSGGTMTGAVTFNKVNNAIAYTGTKATYTMIKFIDNTGDEYGNGISIGGGGLTIIGGGESADAIASGKSGGDEVLYLGSDQNVQIITGVQNGIANAKTFDFKADGTATFGGQWAGRFTANPTSGQVVITDGTTGGIKSSGYTIAKSVPSGAVFTDTNVTQTATTTSAGYEVLFSGTADNTTRTEGARKANNFVFNPAIGDILANYYATAPGITSRLTSLNFGAISSIGSGRTAMRLDLATSTATTGLPPAASGKNSGGFIQTYYWDSGDNAMSQLYIPNGDHITSTGGPQGLMIRGYDRNSTAAGWNDWVFIPFMTTTPVSGQVVISDGTVGGVKTSGYTIAKSIPSNADFNDTKNTAGSTDTSSKIFLIGATSQAANPQTYSDDQVYTTSGTLQTKVTQATVDLRANTANSSTAGGVSLYGTDVTTYGIAFRGTGNSGKHGYVQSDWATYFYMNSGATTRGWVFNLGTSSGVASISGAGNAVFNGSVTVGGNAANTSGVRMVYDSTNECMNLEFVS